MREMSDYEKSLALSASKCYICEEMFDETIPNLTRVLDHDHLNGDFLGVAHKASCPQAELSMREMSDYEKSHLQTTVDTARTSWPSWVEAA